MMSKAFARLLAAFVLAAATPVYPQAAPAAEEPRSAGTEVPVPKRSKFVQPEYPAAALAQGLRGIVILALTIDTSGKVSAVDIVRSLPPFDEAATAAARQWEYEVTRVDGKAVPVRLTVPITFALKLPEISREQGIPELRQGVSPAIPQAPAGQPARDAATVTADVTIDPTGQVVEAEIKDGSSPWSEALLQALRTWRFTPTGGERMVTFEVRADFMTGRGTPRVELRLTDPRTAEAPAAPPEPATDVTPPPAAPAPTSPAAAAPTSPAPGTPVAEPPTAAPPADPATATANPTAPPATEPARPVPAPAGERQAPTTPAAPTDAPAEAPTVPPVTAPAPATPAGTPSTEASAPPTGTPAPPAVEIIPPAPVPPKPVEPGASAVQDVVLGPGVPDLSKGRRPVSPPIARMNAVSGDVEVRFVVEASGASSVRDVAGPELLKEAARQTVSSWMFRRTTPERLPLLAVFSYTGDGATASVKLTE